MPRTLLCFSVLSRAALASTMGLIGCGSVVIDADGEGTTTTATSSSSTTTSSEETTTSDTGSSTTTSTTTEECACVVDSECSAGEICNGCLCFQDPDACPGGANCICAPGEMEPCYSGPAGTEGVGLCSPGTRTCKDGLTWSICEDESVPAPEICNGLDDDCDGVADPTDVDGDGWTACDGDCCEDVSCSEGHPEKVNPGAIEYPGDQIDNDCNPATLDGDAYMTCSDAAYFGPASSTKLLKAMDLCQFTTESPPLSQKTWGVISAALTLADGSSVQVPKDVQVGVLSHYGPNVTPRHGLTMAALSTGTARAEGDPDFVYPQNGPDPGQTGNFNANTASPLPPDYVAAHGGVLPSPCVVCNIPGCETARDPVNLKVRLRAPTNLSAFTFDFSFYTAEYPQNLCTQYDDFFLTLLDAQQPLPDIPPDKNVVFDSQLDPVSVNNAFFPICLGCVDGTSPLVGTGMGGWNGALNDGASTGWLRTQVPVTPGDTIELRFIVWDGFDGNVDSLVLLDRFRFRDPDPINWPD